jgi:glycosyltransferase involved in cell wall biosynthesis
VFFHGHEVLRLLQDYPPPFPWNKRRTRYQLAYRFVDYAKMYVVRTTLNRIRRRNNVGLVFVSEWMRRQFERNVGTSTLAEIPHRCIFNSVAEHFERRTYDRAADVAADFVTIRPLDDSKYGVDLVLDAARGNPNRSFHIFGRGEFFKHFEQPPNVTWFDRFIDQADLPDLLDQYRAALMPTRYDAQGVMACEMATYGIPLITSSIDVMDEVFDGVEGVTRIPNDSFGARLDDSIFELPGKRISCFLSTDLIERELAFFSEIIHTDQQ